MDFRFTNHGSLCLLTPVSEEAQAWADENLNHPETQHWGKGVVIEPRYVGPILEGIDEAGLTVSS